MIAVSVLGGIALLLVFSLFRASPGKVTWPMVVMFGLGVVWGIAVAVLVAGGTWGRLIS